MFSTVWKHLSSGCTTFYRSNLMKSAKLHSKVFSCPHPLSSSHPPSLSHHSLPQVCERGVLTQGVRYVESAANTQAISYQAGSFFGDMRKNITRYMVQGVTAKNLYQSCADGIDYIDFFRACKMPDTFQSWFYVMHLHVWMVLIRLRTEGRFGKNLSYYMVQLMWQDLQERVKLIGVEDTSSRKETMEEYGQQFFGVIVAYDEGLLGHDRVLASALWRNLFYKKADTDAQSLALMVGYVRRQIQYLEQQNSDSILLSGTIKWLPLHENEKFEETDIRDLG